MSTPDHIPAVFQHGSTWVRADFHLHSMADKEFSYAGTASSFASDYVGALKSAGIRVGIGELPHALDAENRDRPYALDIRRLRQTDKERDEPQSTGFRDHPCL